MTQRKKRRKTRQTKDSYQTLKTVWYAKLKKSGFEDVEKDEYRLKQYAAKFNAQDPGIQYGWNFKQEYYSMAREFLNHYKFQTTIDKVIWEYHTEGISCRNISKLLKKVKTLVNPDRNYVFRIISKLKTDMKKAYLPGYKADNE